MIYTFLITIVFIAEIIIAFALIKTLITIDKKICDLDETITLARPSVTDIADLMRKISEQVKELTSENIEKFKNYQEDVALRTLSKMLIAMVLVKANIKTINRFRKSKLGKTLAKGLSILENMV